jgi:hypothetical protein
VLLVDQAVSSASNLVVLIIGARILEPAPLARYALFQLVVTTLIGLQRAILLAPALSMQKQLGRGFIPLRWIAVGPTSSIGLALPLFLLVFEPRGLSDTPSVAVAVATSFCALAQDLVRYALFSHGHALSALVCDLLWLAITTSTLGTLASVLAHPDLLLVAASWGCGALVSAALGVVLLLRRTSNAGRIAVPIRMAWKLGKWASVDSGLSAAINLLPMFIATVAVGASIAGSYRIMQTALSPLNLVNTTIVLKFGLDAWQLADEPGIVALKRRVSTLHRWLVPGSVVVALLVEPAVLLVAGLSPLAVIGPALAVAAVAVFGAWMSPKMAAAQALGYQRFGAYLRVVSVAIASLVSASILLQWPFKLEDPIGPTMVITSLVGLVGWELAYRRALKIETKALTETKV